MIVGINHAYISVPKGEEAAGRAFYCELLGLTEIPKPEPLRKNGGFWLQVGNMQVHVGVEDGVDRRGTKAYIAYDVTDLAYWTQRLAQAGITLLESVQIRGCDRCEFRDPFGNRVELVQRH